ncbi:MAG: hypothetical protein HKN13_15370, partial [Rhodothermales bacterium]|nr:hypothetical protein [Rhodothermales bacterium]
MAEHTEEEYRADREARATILGLKEDRIEDASLPAKEILDQVREPGFQVKFPYPFSDGRIAEKKRHELIEYHWNHFVGLLMGKAFDELRFIREELTEAEQRYRSEADQLMNEILEGSGYVDESKQAALSRWFVSGIQWPDIEPPSFWLTMRKEFRDYLVWARRTILEFE